jgi:hypothetical protein
MGTWIEQSNGRFLLVGTGRTVYIADTVLPAESAFRLQLARPNANHFVFAMVLASGDGRTGYEIGVIGANIVIRSVEFGDPASVKLWTSVAHGLTVAQPFFLEVRVVDGTIEARLNGSSSAAASHTPGDAAGAGGTAAGNSPTFAGYRHFGFVSNVNGAIVASAQVCTLRPQTVDRADLLYAVCGGDVFRVFETASGADFALVKARVFNETGPVSLCEFEQKLYGVDGAHGAIIDPVTDAVTKWIPTAGALPGATAGVDGSTTATIIARHLGRLWLAGMVADPQNLFACAVNAPLDWDTGSEDYGHAFGLTAAEIGKIGQPITALARQAGRNTLVIGCVNSIWELVGDPTTTLPSLVELLGKAGISGKDALTSVATGRLLCHTPHGVYLLPAMGDPVPLSQAVLTEGLNLPRGDIEDYLVQARLDPERNGVYIFLTPKDDSGGADLHFWYDERVGGYSPQLGGWFPDDIESGFAPTASTPEPWLGRVIIGTRDGRLVEFDNDTRDDLGETITTRFEYLLDDVLLNRETILHRMTILPGANTGTIKFKVWGGLTPEAAYGVAGTRHLLASGPPPDFDSGARKAMIRKCRALALVVQVYNDEADGRLEIEEIEAATQPGRILSPRNLSARVVPAPCKAPYNSGAESSSSEAPSFSSGPGNSTQFSSDEGTSFSVTSASDMSPSGSGSSSSSSGGISGGSAISDTPIGHSETSAATSECTAVTDPVGDDVCICPGAT